MKLIFNTPRPTGFQYVKHTSSYPSGHTVLALVVLGFLAYLTGKFCKKSMRWIPYTTASVLILLMIFSRLYLGAHWLADVIGSLFMGFAILFIVIVNYRRRARKRFEKTTSKRFWFILLFFCLVIPWTAWVIKGYNFAKYRYTRVYPAITMSYQQWWNKPLEYLPTYRLNRFGTPIQPFNLQWAANLNTIEKLLLKHHWRKISSQYSVKGTLKGFADKNARFHKPILPWLYRHKPPSLVLIRQIKNSKQIIELRLWNSEAHFTDITKTLWIGTVNYYVTPQKLFGLHHFQKEVSLKETAGIKQLIADLKTRYQFKRVDVPPSQQPEKVRTLHWDGHVIVIR